MERTNAQGLNHKRTPNHTPFPKETLNGSLATLSRRVHWRQKDTKHVLSAMTEDIDVEEQLENHSWADVILLQSPRQLDGCSMVFQKSIWMRSILPVWGGHCVMVTDARRMLPPGIMATVAPPH